MKNNTRPKAEPLQEIMDRMQQAGGDQMTQFALTPVHTHDGSFTGFMPVLVLEDMEGRSEVEVELPWSDSGEPAGLLRRGCRCMMPVKVIDVDQAAFERWVQANPPAVG